MQMTKQDLFKYAAAGTDTAFHNYHSEEAANTFAKFNHIEAAQLRASFAYNHYGRYTAAATVFATTSFLFGALIFAPALLPAALVITTAWLKYTVAAALLATAVLSGLVFFGKTAEQFSKLVGRYKDEELTNYDVALLASTAVAGAGVVGMMYTFPTMLPLVATMGTWTKAATATAISAVSATAAYAAFFGRPKPVVVVNNTDLEDQHAKRSGLNMTGGMTGGM